MHILKDQWNANLNGITDEYVLAGKHHILPKHQICPELDHDLLKRHKTYFNEQYGNDFTYCQKGVCGIIGDKVK